MFPKLGLFVGLTLALRADVTIRYKNDFKFAQVLPPSMNEQALGPLRAALPPSAIVQIKGSKGYSNYGKFISIVDFSKQEITLLNDATKKFATLPLKDYANKVEAAMPAMPPEVGLMKSMKSTVSSRKTGRTEVIQGIRAEENEIVMSMDLSEPLSPLPPGPFMKMVMHSWTVQAEEALHIPAVREWAGFNAYTNYVMDPLAVMQKVLARMPGMGPAMASLVEQRSKAPMLKTQVEMYLPLITQLLPKAGPHGAPASPLDPNAPLLETSSEMVELSTTPIDDSVFQLPGNFQSAPADELLKSLTDLSTVRSTKIAPPVSEQTSQQIPVDGNVKVANLIRKVEPVYPPLAQQARVQGTVRFTVSVDKAGHVVKADLVSGHQLLVTAAKEAVLQWVYNPTLLNGQRIEAVIPADVNFSLP